MKAVTIAERAERGQVWRAVRATEDWPDPGEPGEGELRIRTECSALNHLDLWLGIGIPGVDREYPMVTGCDGCGRVESAGPGADPSWLGKRVIFNAAVAQASSIRPGEPLASSRAPDYRLIGEHTQGAHAELFLVPVGQVADVGDVSPTKAAAFGLTFLTAYSMMVGKGGLRPGQSVLITGIGGGVATAALRIARWLGCPTLVTSRHAAKLEHASELGASGVILDAGEDWSKEVRRLTGKWGVDMVVDTIGEAVHLSCLKSLARGGAYVCAGATSGAAATTDLTRLFWNQLRLLGSTMGTNEEFAELVALLQSEQLDPVIDRVFDWREAGDAWRRLENGEQMGKIVLSWS